MADLRQGTEQSSWWHRPPAWLNRRPLGWPARLFWGASIVILAVTSVVEVFQARARGEMAPLWFPVIELAWVGCIFGVSVAYRGRRQVPKWITTLIGAVSVVACLAGIWMMGWGPELGMLPGSTYLGRRLWLWAAIGFMFVWNAKQARTIGAEVDTSDPS